MGCRSDARFGLEGSTHVATEEVLVQPESPPRPDTLPPHQARPPSRRLALVATNSGERTGLDARPISSMPSRRITALRSSARFGTTPLCLPPTRRARRCDRRGRQLSAFCWLVCAASAGYTSWSALLCARVGCECGRLAMRARGFVVLDGWRGVVLPTALKQEQPPSGRPEPGMTDPGSSQRTTHVVLQNDGRTTSFNTGRGLPELAGWPASPETGIWPTRDRISPTWGRSRLKASHFGPRAHLGLGPGLASCGPNSGKIGPESTNIGRSWAKIGSTSASNDQTRPTFARLGSKLGRHRSNVARDWP